MGPTIMPILVAVMSLCIWSNVEVRLYYIKKKYIYIYIYIYIVMWSTAFVVCVIPLYNSLAPTYNFIYKMRSTIDSPPLLWFAVPVWMTP